MPMVGVQALEVSFLPSELLPNINVLDTLFIKTVGKYRFVLLIVFSAVVSLSCDSLCLMSAR